MRTRDFARGPLFVLAGTLALASVASAQGYPNRPLRIVAPFPPASVTDILARPLGQKLTEAWGQPVVIENRAGAGGAIGAEFVAKAPPDGYTLLMGTNGTNAINASLYPRLAYDPLKDFAPVTLVATSYLLLVVHPSLPVRSVRELIALAKARRGQLSFGSGGSGTTPHLAGELFNTMAGVSMVHVPYKGSPQSTADLLAGRIEMTFSNAAATLPFIRAGRLRVIGISSALRDPALPEVPTIAESGVPGFAAEPWFAVFAPAGTPRDVVQKLNTEIVRIVALPEVRQHYANLGLIASTGTPEQLAATVAAETAKWAKVIKAVGAKVD
ncbi:MAG: Bug family tripartite tricarboxylate transporter substrate binding protein [Burkholderiales bacterium]